MAMKADDVYAILNKKVRDSEAESGKGTKDYNELYNLPSIEGILLVGNVTKEQLGIENGFSPTIDPNPENTQDDYRLDITDINGKKTTPNLIGAKGERGEQGEQGIQGEQGERGMQGEPGESAYQYAQDGGYKGTEEQFGQDLANHLSYHFSINEEKNCLAVTYEE